MGEWNGMRRWPVPESDPSEFNGKRTSGFFWEDRGDRFHCGIDIYAPEGSGVLAIEGGRVLDVGVFTSNGKVPYWNKTWYVLIQNQSGTIGKYAELREATVKVHDRVLAGDLIGLVGSVLNPDRVSAEAPAYIRDLVRASRNSMLHFELYRDHPGTPPSYSGGNVFTNEMPTNLLDPTDYLKEIMWG